METNKNMIENPTAGLSELNPPFTMQAASQQPMTAPRDSMTYQAMYPEVFYKLQPYVLMVCDQMDAFGPMMPTQEMIEQMSDTIHDEVCRMYPDIAKYGQFNMEANDDPPDFRGRGFGMFDRGFGMVGWPRRRRGLLRDMIDILLLSEFFRRRRGF